MAIGNIPARKRGFGYDPVTRSLGVYVDGALTASFPPSPGRTYFVNNITGASTNDGLSWATAVAEVSQAITLAETYRELGGEEGGRSVTTNDYVRNTIMIQGTGTAYTQLTALPNYCDMVGLGADPRGNGTGIARIGPDAIAGGSFDGVDAGTCKGTNFYNLQFQAGSSKDAFDCDKLYRCVFENCAFMGNNDAVSPTAGVLLGTTATAGFGASGVVWRNCHWGGASAGGDFTVGFHIAGTHFHNCLVENCYIIGVTGVFVAGGCTSGWGSKFRDCSMATGYTAQTKSIDDDATTGQIIYQNCFVQVRPTMINRADERSFGVQLCSTAGYENTYTEA